MKYKCDFCEFKSDINFYHYDGKVTSTGNPDPSSKRYYAEIKIKGICPACGKTLEDTLKSEITLTDIVELAIRKAVNNAQM